MSFAHHHDHPQGRQPATPARRRLTLLLLTPAVLLTAVGMLLLWPHHTPQAEATDEPPRVLGQIRTVSPQSCPAAEGENEEAPGPSTPTIACGSVTVTLTSGRDAGTDVTTDIPSGPGAPRLHAGDKVTLLLLDDPTGGGKSYSIIDFQRSHQLWLLGAAFALAVIAFARWRGVTALAGLAVTFAVLLLFIIPAILDGRSPVLVAVVGSAAIMLTVLYLTHGFTTTTSVAVAGTLVSLTITALLSAAATTAAHLSGVADETASYLSIAYQNVDMRGLLLAGIVIGSLGVLDDVTVTQSATVTELAAANPSYRFREALPCGHPHRPGTHRLRHQHHRAGLRRRVPSADAALRRRQHPRRRPAHRRTGRPGTRPQRGGHHRADHGRPHHHRPRGPCRQPCPRHRPGRRRPGAAGTTRAATRGPLGRLRRRRHPMVTPVGVPAGLWILERPPVGDGGDAE